VKTGWSTIVHYWVTSFMDDPLPDCWMMTQPTAARSRNLNRCRRLDSLSRLAISFKPIWYRKKVIFINCKKKHLLFLGRSSHIFCWGTFRLNLWHRLMSMHVQLFEVGVFLRRCLQKCDNIIFCLWSYLKSFKNGESQALASLFRVGLLWNLKRQALESLVLSQNFTQ